MNVNFDDYHKNPEDSQLQVILTGTPTGIKKKLQELINQIDTYGKPVQGRNMQHNVESHVITPMWNKKSY